MMSSTNGHPEKAETGDTGEEATPESILKAMDQIDEIDAERKTLADQRNEVRDSFCERFGLSKKAFGIALKRRRMIQNDPDSVAQFDRTLNVCLNAVAEQLKLPLK